MTPMELAQKYMDCFFGSTPLMAMKELLAEDLVFEGPLVQFNNADDYIDSLIKDPPSHLEYELLHAFEKNNTASLVYTFRKPLLGIEVNMSQTFTCDNGKIRSILLIFDSREFI
ncbi:MAG: nuclear transport factor 2 family protein [Gammaproteobacteria bacterium]|nr:nuclear transport factor 2 family protein [Gammaproteobacteria bacterium]MDH5800449.1 nuclear transport factor 2 family protein [Gammaproteobacteria bacterium]